MTGWQIAKRAALAPLLLLTACGTSETYRQSRAAYESAGGSDYLRHELRATPAEATRVVSTDQALADARTEILAAQERWRARLATSTDDAASPAAALARDPQRDTRLAEGLAADTLAALAELVNPGVLAAEADLAATVEQYPQAANLEAVLQQYNAFARQLSPTTGPQQHRQGVAMAYPSPDMLALKGELVSADVDVARQMVVERRLEVRRQVMTAVAERAYLDQAIVLNQTSEGLLRQMLEVAQSRLRTDTGSYSTVVAAQSQLAAWSTAIETLRDRRVVQTARLNALLGRAPTAALGPITLPPDRQPAGGADMILREAIERRPDLRAQRLRIVRMQTMIDLATRMATPDPTTGASYYEDRMRPAADAPGEPPAFATQRDLNHREAPFFGQRDAYVRELRVRVEAMQSMLVSQEDQARRGVTEVWIAEQTARRDWSLHQYTQLPLAEQAAGATRTAYRAGKTEFAAYLESQRRLLAVSLQAAASLRDQRIAMAALDRQVGTAVDRAPLEPISIESP